MIEKLRVLLLEDHPAHRVLAVEQLRALKCTNVFVAQDGFSALRLLETQGAVDIIICDLTMEGMDGLEFLRHVSQSKMAQGIILFSQISAVLRRAVKLMLAPSDLKVLGDLGKPMKLDLLEKLLNSHVRENRNSPNPRSLTRPDPTLQMIVEGLRRGEFKPYYQPKFYLNTSKPCGAEVLAHWTHPRLGVISPEKFLPLMKQYGLLEMLFDQIFDQGVELQAYFWVHGYRLSLSYNLDMQQLSSLTLTDRIKNVLFRHALPAPMITLEILETGIIQIESNSIENMIRLRMMGCCLAIDDFGIGYSSLQRLCDFPFNQIKLDKHFIRDLNQAECRTAISSTLMIASALDMTMVVEGIESDEQRSQLVGLGATLGQGFWFAKPMGRAEMIQWLNQSESLSISLN